jgi:hypothetical protein
MERDEGGRRGAGHPSRGFGCVSDRVRYPEGPCPDEVDQARIRPLSHLGSMSESYIRGTGARRLNGGKQR